MSITDVTGTRDHDDPPMLVEILFPFPAMWLSSGLGVILFVLAAGFYFGFYVIIHDSTEPCVGPLGGCGTISCTAGTYLPEVYVFMQLTLTLIPLLFVRQLWRTMMDTSPLIREQCKKDNDPQMLSSSSLKLIAQNMTPFQRFIVPAMIYGITATTLTGLFPARYAKNIYDDTSSTSNKRYDQYGDLHTYGVMIGVVVPVSCSFLYFCYHYFVRIPREQDPRFRYYAPGGFYCRAAHIGAVIVAFYVFLNNSMSPNTLEYCSEFKDQAKCESWLRNGEMCPSKTPPTNSFCKWNVYTWSEVQKVIVPEIANAGLGECIRSQCPLYLNAFSIASEYAALFLPVTYLASYALVDLKYMSPEHQFSRRLIPSGALSS